MTAVQGDLNRLEKWTNGKTHEVQQMPWSCIGEELTVTVQPEDQLAKKQLCRKGSEGPGGQQREHELAGNPCALIQHTELY